MASNAPTIGDKRKAAWQCLNFIRTAYAEHQKRKPDVPIFIGLNGVQGAGKTTLVNELSQELQKDGLETIVCSIDDFYLTHEDQVALAENHKDNPLVQHRGEPGMIVSRLMLESLNISHCSFQKNQCQSCSGGYMHIYTCLTSLQALMIFPF